MEIKDKVVVVTGGASGIGAGLAQRFASEGAQGVVVADLDAQGAQRVADAIGPQALALRCDVSCAADIQQLVQQARQRFGRIDIYFSNAGIPPGSRGIDEPDETWERMWRVHTMAHVWAARAVLPDMVERGEGYFLLTS
ncbi:MAG TPA: SDR family oxidoreductase, partial [Ramlibacter sp.]|nr:SDR family oxidoreductase [Ramlibacter sp.]